MPRCFVIQPFDERFTKRFHDTYKPAIEDCGLEAYRVDYDHSVETPIDTIESEIRTSSVVLADITVDNPNVWYELGFAYALQRPVVMICSDERNSPKYPFDIQHRLITRYQVQSLQDFNALRNGITERIKSILKKIETLAAVSNTEEAVASAEGLTQAELAVIAAAAGSVTLPNQAIPVYSLKSDTERAGFTPLAFSLSIKRLSNKKFINLTEGENHNGEPYDAIQLTEFAWKWIDSNEKKFLLKKRDPVMVNRLKKMIPDDDDVDF